MTQVNFIEEKRRHGEKKKKYFIKIHQLYLFLLGVVLTLIQKMIGN